MYRIIFYRIAKVTERFPLRKSWFLGTQCMANLIMDNAVKFEKDLYVVTLDLKDPFGSSHPELLKYTLEKTDFNREMTDIIVDSYTNSRTRIRKTKGTSEEIKIEKGVKQVCPLGPTLSNMCIDTLLRKLKSHKKDFEYEFRHYLHTEDKIVQAFADHVLVFARSKIV
jgi:hypothetical protein